MTNSTRRPKAPPPEQMLLMHQRFVVDPDRGLVARDEYRSGPNGFVPKGTLVGCISCANGYRYVTVQGTHFLVAHVVWFLVTGQWPERQVGHRNNARDDCRPSNLQLLKHRDVTRKARKLTPKTMAKSGYRGLQHTISGTFTATVRVGSVDPEVRRAAAVNLGSFNSPHGAALAFNFAAIRAGYLPEAMNEIAEVHAEEALAAMVKRVSKLRPTAHPFTAAICLEFSARMAGEWRGKSAKEIVASICKPNTSMRLIPAHRNTTNKENRHEHLATCA